MKNNKLPHLLVFWRSSRINFASYVKFLEDLANQKNIDPEQLKNKLADCGLPGTSSTPVCSFSHCTVSCYDYFCCRRRKESRGSKLGSSRIAMKTVFVKNIFITHNISFTKYKLHTVSPLKLSLEYHCVYDAISNEQITMNLLVCCTRTA